jgi:D-alanyl-D-alanine carboxypeptidase
MNKYSKVLELKNTNFVTCHGLPDNKNYSTCEDLIRISEATMKIPLFRNIVKTRYYLVGLLKISIGIILLRSTEKVTSEFWTGRIKTSLSVTTLIVKESKPGIPKPLEVAFPAILVIMEEILLLLC